MQSLRFGASTISAAMAISLAVLSMFAVTTAANAAGNPLPPTTLDSFVAQARQAGVADQIYGDEGVGDARPPYMGFTKAHRINAGIRGANDKGLTTNHGSMLPDAWGRDEFIGGSEMSQSGSNNNSYAPMTTPSIQVSETMPPTAPSFRNNSNSEYDLSGIESGAQRAAYVPY